MAERTDCADCGVRLTPDEREYYGSTCERCERERMREIDELFLSKAEACPWDAWRPSREIA